MSFQTIECWDHTECEIFHEVVTIYQIAYDTTPILFYRSYFTDVRWIGCDKNACAHCIYETSGERTVHIAIAVGRHVALNLMK